jgi:inorganic pyrophosphatase
MYVPKFKAHPWHGIARGEQAPELITAFIEIVPNAHIKYEIDKDSGYLKIDRPQKFSNTLPCLYGFIPKSYSGALSAQLSENILGRKNLVGDGDPLDICIYCEREIIQSDIILQARPIGGFRLIDKGEVDDKIIAVMPGDDWFGNMTDIKEMPQQFIDRLKHYFLTYKSLPQEKNIIEIAGIYGAEEAKQVIKACFDDYDDLLRSAHFN